MSALTYQTLADNLVRYKKKYYTNLLIRGGIVTAALLLTAFLFVNTIEYFGQFDTVFRAILFFSFLTALLLSTTYWVIVPLLKLYNLSQPINDYQAASQIGKYFQEIDDKLVNAIQLHSLSSHQNQLIQASITQKTRELNVFNFSDAIDLRSNNRYVKYLVPPLVVILAILVFDRQFFSESSARIVNFNRKYVPTAPFTFALKNPSLDVFKNEDFTVYLQLTGNTIPDAVFISVNGRKYKMAAGTGRTFSYTFAKVQKPIDFSFEAAGFNSSDYALNLIQRPGLTNFDAAITYPAYLNRKNEKLNNVGNLVVPEGSTIQWTFNAIDADSLLVHFDDAPVTARQQSANVFGFSKTASASQSYKIRLKNEFGTNKEDINYYLEVIPDQHPKITLEQLNDTTLFNFVVLGGNVADDYGFNKLSIVYKITRNGVENEKASYQYIPLRVKRDQTIQNFYYQWDLSDVKLAPGDKIEYFAQVWDNDGVNGSKSTRSSVFTFQLPTEDEINKNVSKSVGNAENQMNSTVSKVDKIRKDITSLENRLKSKKRLDYQDKKLIEDLINKRKELMQEVENMQKQLSDVTKQQERFSEQNQQIAEKTEQLKKLMDELLDDETKKLYEELQKLLEENKNNNVSDLLEKIERKENILEKEIARALEMFKQLQFDKKLDNQVADLQKMAEEQKKLSEESLDKKAEQEKLMEEQKKLSEKFEESKKSLEELQKLDKTMENPRNMDSTSEQEQKISQEQQKSMDQLQEQKNKDASKSQKNASEQMKQLADKLSEMQSQAQMEQNQENMDNLRDILENLITLSFDQEGLMKDFRNVNLSDPRFVKLSQQQLKLKDDAKIIEDSLYSLAKRVFQIESFVTREVSAMKENMDGSVKGIRDRKLNVATGKQQLAMTSMNNLALLLNDALKQMQEQMAQAQMGKPQNSNKKSPGLSELQKQLNDKIQQLQKNPKSGRALSEDLAKLAAEQELIRNALQELENQIKQQKKQSKGESPGGDLEDLKRKMEETEKDLVNKNIDPETIKRQRDILTRLLESEKASKEREEEERREAEQAKEKERKDIPQFSDYIKNKEKEVELLKTIPPALLPYYRKEVDEYFRKIDR